MKTIIIDGVEYNLTPKVVFREGDWVVSPNGVYWHIDKISNNRYEVTSNTGEGSNWNLDTNIYHKFTIQDAKDGDVLVFKNNIGGIIICKSPTDYDTRSYCRLVSDNFINKEESGWDSTLLVPAIKEQHDILMKAMTDAGYIFDFEKKELKKIEQKSAEWSEEDEKILNGLISSLVRIEANTRTDSTSINYTFPREIAWLKSLKERYAWKPSDEQMDSITCAVWKMKESACYDSELVSLFNDLKKLRKE